VNWFSRGGGETRILVSAERPEMIGQLSALALLFVLTFGLNLNPAFAPPTWMAVAFVGFEFPDTKPLGSNDHLV
jgi:hypothetical protein